ncbi:MAG TPA: type II toxin-antitoxin system HicB family antitoxin [Mycobacteriales bacterium]|jgi:predicted RNase H-like HicB family nuclease|nr:type II toxin-antitoxin system HicB family antitoxin [Mycobacteriales bacterium]
MTGYPIVIEQAADGGYGAWCPDFPGCIALGDSYEECISQMREAIGFHIDGLRNAGEPVPPPAAMGSETVLAS